MTYMQRIIVLVVSVFVVSIIVALVVFLHRTDTAINLGTIVPLTGDNAVYGIALKNGMEVAVEELNNRGGISGRSLALAFEDDQASPQQSLNAFHRLISGNRPPLIIGAMFSSCTIALAPQAESRKIVLLSPTSSAVEITTLGDYVFRIYPSDSYDGAFLANVALDRLEAKSAAIIFLNLASTKQIAEVFEQRFVASGGRILSVDGYSQGERDFRTQLVKVSAQKPDVVFLPGYLTENALLLRQARELGISARFLTVSSFHDPKAIELAADAAEGVIFSTPFFDPKASDPFTQHFVTAYEDRFGESPTVWAAYGYDVVRVAANALSVDLWNAEEIKRALYATHDFPGVTGTISFDANGDVKKELRLMTVKNRRFVPFEGN